MMLSGPDMGAIKIPSRPTALGPETYFALRACWQLRPSITI
jgi:hypothetical protein